MYQYRPTNLLINSDGLTPGDNTVTSAKIVNGTIVAADLADDAVTTAKIADDAVTTALIADDAITAALIADDAVGAAAIADNAVDIARLNVSDGTNGQLLKTNGSGTLSFTDPPTGGASAGKAFFMGLL